MTLPFFDHTIHIGFKATQVLLIINMISSNINIFKIALILFKLYIINFFLNTHTYKLYFIK